MTENLLSSLRAFQAMADFGHQLNAEQAFPDRAHQMLCSLASAMAAPCAAIYVLSGKTELRLVTSVQDERSQFPQHLRLFESHLRALLSVRGPRVLSDAERYRILSAAAQAATPALSSELFTVLAPLHTGSSVVGMLVLGSSGGMSYGELQMEAIHLLCGPLALLLENNHLVQQIEAQIKDNLRLVSNISELQEQALQAFALAIDAKDVSRRGHSPRVAWYATAIGKGLGMDAQALSGVRAAGFLHDIGDMNIDKALFRKQSALHPEEFREIADHSIFGYQIVRNIKFPWPEVSEVVRSHHERADGSGYPDRLHNNEVSLAVKIVAAADSLDAMLSERPYRGPVPLRNALADLVRFTPQKYDASVVQALLVQLRREAEGKGEERILPMEIETPSISEYDALSFELLQKITNQRVFSA